MGLLDELFKEADKLKKEKDIAEGFAEGVRNGRFRKEHPIAFPIKEAASKIEDVIKGPDFATAKKAGIKYVEKYEK